MLFLVGTVVAACATLPPAKPVTDLKGIAGKWEGTVTAPSGSYSYKLAINENGTWQGTSDPPIGGTARFEGSILVRNGKALWLSRTTGRSGTYTLHEGDGRRVLAGGTDDGSVTMKLTPAK